MPRLIMATLVALCLIGNPSLGHAESRSLIPQLEKFRPFLGKTHRGTFSDSTQANPVVDISRWERALSGSAVRIMHSLNKGQYGGETIIFWDPSAEQVRYYYFTTAGFYTQGSAEFDGANFVSTEKVTGNQDGIDEVKATAVLKPDGLTVNSQYLKQGEVISTSSANYVVDNSAEVILP